MKNKKWHWPFLRINSGGSIELECKHGIGHGGVHGCDDCCHSEEFEEHYGKYKVKVEELEKKCIFWQQEAARRSREMDRWKFRHDFMENWLVKELSFSKVCTKKQALEHIRECCEEAMRKRGLKYPYV